MIGILSLFIAWQVTPDTPKKSRDMDWLGLILLSVGIGATQYLLDRGNTADWFSAKEIRVAALLAMLGLFGFVVHSLGEDKNSVFNLRILKARIFWLPAYYFAYLVWVYLVL